MLRNAPAARPSPVEGIAGRVRAGESRTGWSVAGSWWSCTARRWGASTSWTLGTQRILSKVDDAFTGLMHRLTDEAKEGPRLFSFEPVDPGFFDRPKWISEKFRVTLWCEHSRLPLPALNGKDDKRGRL